VCGGAGVDGFLLGAVKVLRAAEAAVGFVFADEAVGVLVVEVESLGLGGGLETSRMQEKNSKENGSYLSVWAILPTDIRTWRLLS
jgi:hypothetical protein